MNSMYKIHILRFLPLLSAHLDNLEYDTPTDDVTDHKEEPTFCWFQLRTGKNFLSGVNESVGSKLGVGTSTGREPYWCESPI